MQNEINVCINKLKFLFVTFYDSTLFGFNHRTKKFLL